MSRARRAPLATCVLLVACGSEDERPPAPSPPPDAGAALEAAPAGEVLRATLAQARTAHAEAAERAGVLERAVEAFLADPTPGSLEAARRAWAWARAAWARGAAHRVSGGPLPVELALARRVDAGWTDPAAIDFVPDDPGAGLVNAGPGPVEPDALRALAGAAEPAAPALTGFPALGVLLWRGGAAPEEAGAPGHLYYAPGDPVRERRRSYLRAATRLLVEDVAAAWARLEPSDDVGGASPAGAAYLEGHPVAAAASHLAGLAVLTSGSLTGRLTAPPAVRRDVEALGHVMAGVGAAYRGTLGDPDADGAPARRPGLAELARPAAEARHERVLSLLAEAEERVRELAARGAAPGGAGRVERAALASTLGFLAAELEATAAALRSGEGEAPAEVSPDVDDPAPGEDGVQPGDREDGEPSGEVDPSDPEADARDDALDELREGPRADAAEDAVDAAGGDAAEDAVEAADGDAAEDAVEAAGDDAAEESEDDADAGDGGAEDTGAESAEDTGDEDAGDEDTGAEDAGDEGADDAGE